MKKKRAMIIVILLLIGTALPISGMRQEHQHDDYNSPACTKTILDHTYRRETSPMADQLDQSQSPAGPATSRRISPLSMTARGNNKASNPRSFS